MSSQGIAVYRPGEQSDAIETQGWRRSLRLDRVAHDDDEGFFREDLAR